VGYQGNRVRVLLPFAQKLYGATFVELDGQRYYDATPWLDGTRVVAKQPLFTYRGSYPAANRTVDLRLPGFPSAAQRRQRTLAFEWRGTRHSLVIEYGADAVDFLQQYPPTELGVYLGGPVDGPARRSLEAGLLPLLKGKSPEEAVNLLLRFVQTAFLYKTDGEQFGRERSFFPLETLAYPYSDCEDRAALFLWLVKNLLGLDAIGLRYPGHVAAAVKIPLQTGRGDTVEYKGQLYLVADPTYVNASAGMAMPQFKGERPEVVEIR